jgi:carbamate kinase
MVIEKNVKMTNNDLQNTTQKTKIGHHERHWKPRRTQVSRKDNQFLYDNKTIGYFYCAMHEKFGETKL